MAVVGVGAGMVLAGMVARPRLRLRLPLRALPSPVWLLWASLLRNAPPRLNVVRFTDRAAAPECRYVYFEDEPGRRSAAKAKLCPRLLC